MSKCLHCGGEVTPRAGFVVKYCSPKCRSQWNNEHKTAAWKAYLAGTTAPLGLHLDEDLMMRLKDHAEAHTEGNVEAAGIEIFRSVLTPEKFQQEQGKRLAEMRDEAVE